MLVWLVLLACVRPCVAATCFREDGTSLCDHGKCKQIVATCTGNIGKDSCGCCDICLKQRGESCGGFRNEYGKCDHDAQYCVKPRNGNVKKCHTLKDLLLAGDSKYIVKMRKCKRSPEYKKDMVTRSLFCFLKVKGPTFYCKKNPQYRNDDCCIHNNGCHPNKALYDKVEGNVNSYPLLGNSRKY